MPELPEVEIIVRELQALIVGRRIETVKVRLNKLVRTGPRRLARFLRGAQVLRAGRRGKFIILSLSGDRFLIIHLKMTGGFLWGPMPRAWPKHVHLIIGFESGGVLLYRDMRQFGYFLGLPEDEYRAWLVGEEVGPDPFQLTPAEFASRLSRKKGRIKSVLLNQSFVSGLGNIYTDEALFAAGIHPSHPADHLEPELAVRLHREIIKVLEGAIRYGGSTTRNYRGLSGVGQFQTRHNVYGKSGAHCPVCGDPVVRLVVAGRGTHVCPACQPERW
jgi:formamidopyrimidine-DNA glycosylase